jgi:hypothetical protein
MGWLGTALVGAAVGWFGWRWHPMRAGFQVWLALAASALAACAAKLAGNLSGLFYDGQTLEWLVSVLAAIAAVLLLGRRATRSRPQS